MQIFICICAKNLFFHSINSYALFTSKMMNKLNVRLENLWNCNCHQKMKIVILQYMKTIVQLCLQIKEQMLLRTIIMCHWSKKRWTLNNRWWKKTKVTFLPPRNMFSIMYIGLHARTISCFYMIKRTCLARAYKVVNTYDWVFI